MDNLTHTAIGLFLSRAGLGRWSPSATPIVLLAANAPDIDVLSAVGGSLNYLHYHRQITHSLVAMPCFSLTMSAFLQLMPLYAPELSTISFRALRLEWLL